MIKISIEIDGDNYGTQSFETVEDACREVKDLLDNTIDYGVEKDLKDN